MSRAQENDEVVIAEAAHRLELALLPTSALGNPMRIAERGFWTQTGFAPIAWADVELKSGRVVTGLGLKEGEVVLRAGPGWYARVRRGPEDLRLSIFAWIARDGLLMDSLWRPWDASEATKVGWQLQPLGRPERSGELVGYFHKRTWPEPARRWA